MKKFIANIELILSGVGVILILGIPAFFSPETTAGFYRVATITAIGVGLLHGMIFWVIRRRQRKIRERSIMEIREMLADVVKNQLTVIDMYVQEADQQADLKAEMKGIKHSIEEISQQVDSLSEESLRDWKRKYPEAIENSTQVEAVA